MHLSGLVLAVPTLTSAAVYFWLQDRAKRRRCALPTARPLSQSEAYLSLPEVGKELRDLWAASVALGGDDPVDSLAILDVVRDDRHFVAYRRLLESSARDGLPAARRHETALRGAHVESEPALQMTPHVAASLEIALELAHQRGTPATSADVLEGLAVVPGSLAFNILRELGYLPRETARTAWRRMERGELLFCRREYDGLFERCEPRAAALAVAAGRSPEAGFSPQSATTARPAPR